MLDALDISEEEAAGLAELAASDLAMAKEFAARARVVDDPELACELARVSQRYARSFRQCLALKLKRELIAAAAAERPEPPKPHVPRDVNRIKARIEALRDPIQRMIWSEYERPEPPEHPDSRVHGFPGQARE